MALPLPNVIPDVGPGGRIVTALRGINALTNDQLDTQIKSSNAQYAPYTNYANALSKIAYSNYLPAQLQAQALSNPMLFMALKDNPEAIKGLIDNFSRSIPTSQNMLANIPAPSQQQNSGGLLNMLFNHFRSTPGMNNSSIPNNNFNMPNNVVGSSNIPNNNQGMVSDNNSNNNQYALVPASRGSIAGMIGKQIAPFYESPYGSGKTVVDPNTGKPISVPTGESVTAAQNTINAAERVLPQLEELSDAAGPFLSAKGILGNQLQRGWNALVPSKAGSLPTQYAKFHSLLQSAPEALVKSYGLRPTNETIERMQKVIEPYFGETKEQYKSRILDQLRAIREEQIAVSKKQLSQGFDLSNQNSPKASFKNNVQATKTINGKTYHKINDQWLPVIE
jgi:hypothetical protein